MLKHWEQIYTDTLFSEQKYMATKYNFVLKSAEFVNLVIF